MQFERMYSLNYSIVVLLAHPRISGNSPKSGEMCVVVMVLVCIHMPIHCRRRC